MKQPLFPIAILAGGLATRLRPATEQIPKALLEVAGEPFLAHQLRLLHGEGIRRVVMCVGYLGEQIREYAGDGSRFGVELTYSFDGPQLRGTAGTVRQALDQLGDRFFVVYGDSYLPCDYRAVQEAFTESAKPALMTVFRNEGRWDTSNIEFRGGRILAYDKQNRTSSMQHIDYGLGVFERSVFETIPADAVKDLAEVYQDLLGRGELAACEVEKRFYEAGSWQGIEELNRLLARRSEGEEKS